MTSFLIVYFLYLILVNLELKKRSSVQKNFPKHPIFNTKFLVSFYLKTRILADPDRKLHPENFKDDTDVPMKDPKKSGPKGIDQMYEKYMEIKDYDNEGRVKRGSYVLGFLIKF